MSAATATTPAELAEVYARLQTADAPVFEEGQTTCCYAKSEKSWINDPQGVPWETFLTTGESTTYGGGAEGAARRLARRDQARRAAAARARWRPRGTPPLQRALPLHRQLGALDHGRGDPDRLGARQVQRPTRPARMPKGEVHPEALALLKRSTSRPTTSARRAGTSSPRRTRRRSISSSPSATTPPAKSARSGRASR